MLSFRSIQARELLDSRGCPTVEAVVCFSDGSFGQALVPSGASKGRLEASELRDGEPHRYDGKGVLKAVRNIQEEIAPPLLQGAVSPLDISAVDRFLCALDGTPQKQRLGANAILAVSLATAKAVAMHQRLPLYRIIAALSSTPPRPWRLPTPMMNLMNGGIHAAHQGLPVQELMMVPFGASSLKEAIRMGSEVFWALKRIFQSKGYSTSVGDEGGVVAPFRKVEEGFELMLQAIESAGYRPGEEVGLALDCAASAWWDAPSQSYRFIPHGPGFSREALLELYATWVARYPIVSIEDGFDEEDWEGFAAQQERFGDQVQCVGDDLFVTQKARLAQGIRRKAANAILIKLNQVGSLTETLETMALAQSVGMQSIVSHRSGETEDVSLVHLAIGAGAQQIKTGSLSRSERIGKYNELMRIAESLGDAALFAGRQPFQSLKKF